MKATPIVFLGPSLPLSEAKKVLRADFEPPARQGDVWRVLARKPAAIALIDGVFEAQPSVWHRELLSALEEGVAVFGASSMGALRAAEMAPFGMIGVGEIFEQFRSGRWNDDSDVALLHADEEHGYRALTVPLVNVRHAARLATAQKVLKTSEARALVRHAEAIFYQERTWSAVLQGLPERLRARLQAWLRVTDVDLKRSDALACLEQCAAFVRSGAVFPPLELPTPSALVRRRRVLDSEEGGVSGARVLGALQAQAEAPMLTQEGAQEVLAATLGAVLGAPSDWIDEAPWRLADGPDRTEAVILGARRRGRWQQLVQELAPRRKGARKGSTGSP